MSYVKLLNKEMA